MNKIVYKRVLQLPRNLVGSRAMARRLMNNETLAGLKVSKEDTNQDKKTMNSTDRLPSDGILKVSSWKLGGILGILGLTGYGYMKYAKNRVEIEREIESNRQYSETQMKKVGGGEFKLIDQNGQPFTQDDLKGKFSIIYFGFTHCPDICPEQLDKLGVWLDGLAKHHIDIQPLFISCDPDRDTPEVINAYLKDFHPKIIGLTGDYDEVKQMCKSYRVYFNTPRKEDVKQDDYLVDHSILFYLVAPEGEYIDALGASYDEDKGIDRIRELTRYYMTSREQQRQQDKWYGFLFKT